MTTGAKSTIEGFVSSGKIPHAICFTGEGAASLAEYTARLFLCGQRETPCETCADCMKARNKSHPDLIRAAKFTDGGKYKVGEIRKITADSATRPNDGDLKVYIFENAELMPPACQNALLKFTEEPPDYVRIIFTAKSRDLLLDTIKSRLVFIDAADESENTENSETADSEELRKAARDFVQSLSKSDEYAAAAALARVKTRDGLSLIIELISAELRTAMLGGVFGLPNAAEAQKFLLDFAEDLKYNPNINLACTYITTRIGKVLKM